MDHNTAGSDPPAARVPNLLPHADHGDADLEVGGENIDGRVTRPGGVSGEERVEPLRRISTEYADAFGNDDQYLMRLREGWPE